ncbi:extensin-like [Iris pallida]|uniref:Extensin-like n=1 Tax=Iris pallida TaxID=29817 RepID=A0AAX6HEY8_IRIPA|nr:extensin-like [Iris pallida]
MEDGGRPHLLHVVPSPSSARPPPPPPPLPLLYLQPRLSSPALVAGVRRALSFGPLCGIRRRPRGTLCSWWRRAAVFMKRYECKGETWRDVVVCNGDGGREDGGRQQRRGRLTVVDVATVGLAAAGCRPGWCG